MMVLNPPTGGVGIIYGNLLDWATADCLKIRAASGGSKKGGKENEQGSSTLVVL